MSESSPVASPSQPEPTPVPDIEEVKTTAAVNVAKPNDEPQPETKESTEPVQEIIDPEPQNPLTKKFTEDEWTALKEFRVCEPRPRC